MSDPYSETVDQEFDLDQLTAINPADIRLAAMNLLARREHSQKELCTKLARRYADADMVQGELSRLADENLQSDQRFAESFVRQRAARGKGPLRLQQELRERGVSEADVEFGMEEADVDWHALAAQVLAKKFGDTRSMDVKQRAKCIRFMQYRGFSGDHYRRLV